MNFLSRGIVIRDLCSHIPNVHEVVTLTGDICSVSDLKSAHSSGGKAFIKHTTDEDGILHPVVSVILQSARGGLLSTVQNVGRRPHGRSAFKLGGHKAADMDLGSGIDEGNLRLPRDGRDDRVNAGQLVA